MGTSMWCYTEIIIALLEREQATKHLVHSTLDKVLEILMQSGIFANNAAHSFTMSLLISSIRFECEIPDESLQCKMFQLPQEQDSLLKLGDYYVNARRFLMLNHTTMNGYEYKTFTTKRIKFSGLIYPCYVDNNGVKTEYIIRFISGFMAVCRKITDGNKDDNE